MKKLMFAAAMAAAMTASADYTLDLDFNSTFQAYSTYWKLTNTKLEDSKKISGETAKLTACSLVYIVGNDDGNNGYNGAVRDALFGYVKSATSMADFSNNTLIDVNGTQGRVFTIANFVPFYHEDMYYPGLAIDCTQANGRYTVNGDFTEDGHSAYLYVYALATYVGENSGDTYYQALSGNALNGFNGATSKTLYAPNPSFNAPVTAAIPEPTSALLMLLGMAGLALRRKQA